MKTHRLLLLPLFLMSLSCAAQQTQDGTTDENEKTYWVEQVKVRPQYPGGDKAFLNYINRNTVYPRDAKQEKGVTIVHFVISKTGKITDVKVYRSSGDPAMDREATNVIKSVKKKFKPGTIDGKPVNVYFSLPIRFMTVGADRRPVSQ